MQPGRNAAGGIGPCGGVGGRPSCGAMSASAPTVPHRAATIRAGHPRSISSRRAPGPTAHISPPRLCASSGANVADVRRRSALRFRCVGEFGSAGKSGNASNSEHVHMYMQLMQKTMNLIYTETVYLPGSRHHPCTPSVIMGPRK
eukprot:gene102-biopygen4224